MLFLLFFTSITFGANDSSYDKGFVAYQSGEYEKAFKLFTDAANQGDADAQYSLGLLYYYGEGVTQDYKKAVKWFTFAAEEGYAKAQFILGAMYFIGQGVWTSQILLDTFSSYNVTYNRGVYEQRQTVYQRV